MEYLFSADQTEMPRLAPQRFRQTVQKLTVRLLLAAGFLVVAVGLPLSILEVAYLLTAALMVYRRAPWLAHQQPPQVGCHAALGNRRYLGLRVADFQTQASQNRSTYLLRALRPEHRSHLRPCPTARRSDDRCTPRLRLECL